WELSWSRGRSVRRSKDSSTISKPRGHWSSRPECCHEDEDNRTLLRFTACRKGPVLGEGGQLLNDAHAQHRLPGLQPREALTTNHDHPVLLSVLASASRMAGSSSRLWLRYRSVDTLDGVGGRKSKHTFWGSRSRYSTLNFRFVVLIVNSTACSGAQV